MALNPKSETGPEAQTLNGLFNSDPGNRLFVQILDVVAREHMKLHAAGSRRANIGGAKGEARHKTYRQRGTHDKTVTVREHLVRTGTITNRPQTSTTP